MERARSMDWGLCADCGAPSSWRLLPVGVPVCAPCFAARYRAAQREEEGSVSAHSPRGVP